MYAGENTGTRTCLSMNCKTLDKPQLTLVLVDQLMTTHETLQDSFVHVYRVKEKKLKGHVHNM